MRWILLAILVLSPELTWAQQHSPQPFQPFGQPFPSFPQVPRGHLSLPQAPRMLLVPPPGTDPSGQVPPMLGPDPGDVWWRGNGVIMGPNPGDVWMGGEGIIFGPDLNILTPD